MPEMSTRGRKLKHPRKHSSRPRRKNPPTRKRKVSKKAMVKSRAAIVETKSRIQSEIALGTQIVQPKNFKVLNDVFVPLPLHAYTCMEQGLGEDQMIGQSVFSKYLNGKFQFRFPGGNNTITDRHYAMELICGWIPIPLGFTTFTSTNVNNVLPSDITSFITQRIAEYFSARTDRLDFIPKRDSNIRITYRRKILSKQNENNVLNIQATDTGYYGHIPDVMLYPQWKTNRKVFYERGNTYTNGASPGSPEEVVRRNFFPNYSWIPFAVVYSPMYAGEQGNAPLGDASCPRVSYNVAHYFTDS